MFQALAPTWVALLIKDVLPLMPLELKVREKKKDGRKHQAQEATASLALSQKCQDTRQQDRRTSHTFEQTKETIRSKWKHIEQHTKQTVSFLNGQIKQEKTESA